MSDNRSTMTDRVIEEASKNSEFRAMLLADPKGALEGFLGFAMPEGMTVTAVEESPSNVYIVLPMSGNTNLSEADLDLVAGGNYVNGVNQDCY